MVMVIAKIVRGLFYLNLRFETVKNTKKRLETREIIAIFYSFITLELYRFYKRLIIRTSSLFWTGMSLYGPNRIKTAFRC